MTYLPNAPAFRLLEDQVLVKKIDPPATERGLHVPMGSRGDRFCDEGIVVAVGPGDKMLRIECRQCGEYREFVACHTVYDAAEGIFRHRAPSKCLCGADDDEILGTTRAPMYVKPGDRVLYERRSAEVLLGGEKYRVLREEQHIHAVIEA